MVDRIEEPQVAGDERRVQRGAVNAKVILELPGGARLVSIITNASGDSLGLNEGKEAYAVIKTPSVMIAVD